MAEQQRRNRREQRQEETPPEAAPDLETQLGGTIATIVRETAREVAREELTPSDEGDHDPEAGAEEEQDGPQETARATAPEEPATTDAPVATVEDDAPPTIADARHETERLRQDEARVAGELKSLIGRWLANEVTGGDLDEAKGRLQAVAGQRKVAEITFEVLRDREAARINQRVAQAKSAINTAIDDFLNGHIGPEQLAAVRERWAAVQADAQAIGTTLGSPLARTSTGTSRRGGPRGTGQRRSRVLRTNAAGELVYRMKDYAVQHLIGLAEDGAGLEDVVQRLATAAPQSKERLGVVLSPDQAERVRPLVTSAITMLSDQDVEQKAIKRQFGLLLQNINEYLAGDPTGDQDATVPDEDDEDEDEDEEGSDG